VPDDREALRINLRMGGEEVQAGAESRHLCLDLRRSAAEPAGAIVQGKRPWGRSETTPWPASADASSRNWVRLPSGASESSQCQKRTPAHDPGASDPGRTR
jgi:hypothetical protein